MKKLRTKTLGTLKAGTAPVALPASSACDIEVFFARPAATASDQKIQVQVPGGFFYMSFGSSNVQVGFSPSKEHAAAASDAVTHPHVDSRGKPVKYLDTVRHHAPGARGGAPGSWWCSPGWCSWWCSWCSWRSR